MRGLRRCALPLAALLAAGCGALLPKEHTEVTSPWRSFDEAKNAIERIVPERSTAGELRSLGLDPYASPNVQLLSYSDILLRFPVGPSHREGLDAGLRRCLDAGKACTGLYVTARDLKRDRTGNFWQDAFGFKRVVDITGWNFNALVLLVDERVVYTLYGGQPNVREQEITRQPLGPLQDFGESVGNLVR